MVRSSATPGPVYDIPETLGTSVGTPESRREIEREKEGRGRNGEKDRDLSETF